jgi:hypothetical protein
MPSRVNNVEMPLPRSPPHARSHVLHRFGRCRPPPLEPNHCLVPRHRFWVKLSALMLPRAPSPTCLLSAEKLTIPSHYPTPSGPGNTAVSFHNFHCPSPARRTPPTTTLPRHRWLPLHRQFALSLRVRSGEPSSHTNPPIEPPRLQHGCEHPHLRQLAAGRPDLADKPPAPKGGNPPLFSSACESKGQLVWTGFLYYRRWEPVAQYHFTISFGIYSILIQFKFKLSKFIGTWIYTIKL